VIQRVLEASVTVDGQLVSRIGPGLCVLVGMSTRDTEKEAEALARKLVNLRLWPDSEDKGGKWWARSVKQMGLEILCVSQFTLHARLKGNKPDFHNSMPAERASGLYEYFLTRVSKEYDATKVKSGRFGAMMSVNIVNHGPVTICLNSPGEEREDGEDAVSAADGKADA
jgi:D-tyrosyl-tRNA(Tyr) deacylase